MDHQDRELILGLANRLRQAPPVAQDPEAAQLIAQQITSQPNAVYLLVQAVLLQEEALRQAQTQSSATGMAQAGAGYAPNPAFAPQPGYGANAGYAQNPAFVNPAFAQQHSGYGHDPHTGPGARGGFMSRMFGQDGNAGQPAYGQQQPGAGGGFMKTAAAAAAGVAGGALLVAGANELFSDNQPQANQAQAQPQGGEDDGGFSLTDLF